MPTGVNLKTALGYVGITLATALIAAAAVMAVMSGRLSGYELIHSDTDKRLDRIEAAVASLTVEVASSAGTTDSPPAQPPSPTPPVPDSTPPESSLDDDVQFGRQFCYIREIKWEGSTPEIKVDYAQMLTGSAAAAAAAARGDESPPPNDYYILNENTKLRSFPAQSSMSVKLTSTDGGASAPSGYTVGFGQFADMYAGMSGGASGVFRNVPYWITIDGGTITSIEEQYLP